jgi:hypothetical protein
MGVSTLIQSLCATSPLGYKGSKSYLKGLPICPNRFNDKKVVESAMKMYGGSGCIDPNVGGD